MEKIQSVSRPSGTNMAPTRGESVGWIGESSTATRRGESEHVGWGIVKEMKREGVMLSKVDASRAITHVYTTLLLSSIHRLSSIVYRCHHHH